MTGVLQPPRAALFPSFLTIVALLVSSHARAQFSTVINAPPDESPFYVGSDTQVNLYEGSGVSGAVVGDYNEENSNVEVNVFGGVYAAFEVNNGSVLNVIDGEIRQRVFANRGSQVYVSGGAIAGILSRSDQRPAVSISAGWVGASDDARVGLVTSGGEVNFSGGSIGDFSRFGYSTVNIYGGEFHLNGAPIPGLESVGDSIAFDLLSDTVLSGTLVDGTPFAFSTADQNLFVESTLVLTATSLPLVGPTLINADVDVVPLGIRSGQTLFVGEGGGVDHNFNAGLGSKVVIAGGAVGRNLEAVGADVVISGGTVGARLGTFHGSDVTVTGGTIGQQFHVYAGGTASVSGGAVGNRFVADSDSTLHVFGGSIGEDFTAKSGSQVSIMGASWGDRLTTLDGSAVSLAGDEFRLNGMPIAGLQSIGDSMQIDLAPDSLLTGTLTDGTPFAFHNIYNERIADGTLTLIVAERSSEHSPLITLPNDPAPLGITSGQTLIVRDGGFVGSNFSAGWDSYVEIHGGEVGDEFEAAGAMILVAGGAVGSGFEAYAGSVVNISGGVIGDRFNALAGSQVNISGGVVGDRFYAQRGSHVNIAGGEIGDEFLAREGSVVNLFGTQFWHGGAEITSTLTLGVPFTIQSARARIGAVLSDGSSLLVATHSGATVTITLVPEPSAHVIAVLAIAASRFLSYRRCDLRWAQANLAVSSPIV